MQDFMRSFRKIIPSLRESTLEITRQQKLKGERIWIPVGDHEVEVYWHPAEQEMAPVLFEMHGGGFVMGDASKDDSICEYIKEKAKIHVIGINYRKAPEHPYPCAVEDVYGVIRYVHDHAGEFRILPEQMAVMGYSCGANLAAVMAILAKERKEFSLKCQILHYPFLDAIADPFEKERHPADLAPEIMYAFNELYAAPEKRAEPYVSPLYATEEMLAGTAPGIILPVEDDALCEEGILYGKKLTDAKVPVFIRRIHHAHHGYIEDAFNEECYESMAEDIKAAFDPQFKESAKEAIDTAVSLLLYFLN